MSSTPILNALKDESLKLRKARDPLGPFLTSILSAANDLAKHDTKDGITPPLNDDYVMRAIRTAMKQQDDVIEIIKQRNGTDQDISPLLAKKTLLQNLLPAAPTEEELKATALSIIESLHTSNPKQLIGPTIKGLAEKYGASLDKGLASKIVQEIISTL